MEDWQHHLLADKRNRDHFVSEGRAQVISSWILKRPKEEVTSQEYIPSLRRLTFICFREEKHYVLL